jgi:soluble lytic murein transglycosylase-like protein
VLPLILPRGDDRSEAFPNQDGPASHAILRQSAKHVRAPSVARGASFGHTQCAMWPRGTAWETSRTNRKVHGRRPPVQTSPSLIILIALFTVSAITTAGAEEPRLEPASLQGGIDAYRVGASLRALAIFLKVAHTNPQSALPAIWAGIAATAAGRTREAEAYFREGLRRPHSAFQDRIAQGWLRRLSVLQEAAPAAPGAPNAIAALAHASNPRLTWKQAVWIGDHVVTAARKEGLDPWLLAAVIYFESRFDHTLTNGTGATGLGQLMPQTAQAAHVNPKDPWGNLVGTAMTLRAYYREFDDWRLALAAYNAGDGAVRQFNGIPPYAETRWYVNAVWTLYQRIAPIAGMSWRSAVR